MMKDDYEREHLKEMAYLREKEFEEMEELEDSIRIIMKKPAEINVEFPKEKHEHITKIDSLPFQ